MLRLWPEVAKAGIFENHCWLKPAGGGAMQIQRYDDAQDALEAFQELLAARAWRRLMRPRLHLTVSDTRARILALPWQEQLDNASEVKRYAQAMLERAGHDLDETWIMHAEFAQHGGMGLAYALPADWMRRLADMTMANGLALQRMQPVSAAGYFWQGGKKVTGNEVLLLCEHSRITALLRSDGRLAGLDAEAATAEPAQAATRLLRRLQLRHGGIARLARWSEQAAFPENVAAAIARELPDVNELAVKTEGLG